MKHRIRVLVISVLTLVMMLGSALPAFAVGEGPGSKCTWDWDRYLWRNYDYELWYYYCDDGNDSWYIAGFWTPDQGFSWNT